MTPERLVFASRQAPLPDDTGSRIRSHRLLTGLARRFPTTLVTFAHDRRSGEHPLDAEALADALPEVEVVAVPGARAPRRLRQARSLASVHSWEWGRYARGRPARLLHAALALRGDPDTLLHLDDPGVAQAAEGITGMSAFAPHNVEHRIVRDAARTGSAARRAFGALDWRRLAREERRLWRNATVCVAVSELDAAAMRAGGAQDVIVCPNGADPRPAAPPPVREPGDPVRILFVGSTSYEPYRRGLRWFVGEVLPLLRDDVDVRFTVVGGRPRDALEGEGIDYAGRVPELDPFYQQAHVVVVPVFEGSGTRLKIPEAISYSRPVVSTTLGAEGLPLRPGEHFLLADEPEQFARALREAASRLEPGGDGVGELLARAREAIEPLLWPRIADALADAYAALGDVSTVATMRSTRSSRR